MTRAAERVGAPALPEPAWRIVVPVRFSRL
jgi:hypothetical protein